MPFCTGRGLWRGGVPAAPCRVISICTGVSPAVWMVHTSKTDVVSDRTSYSDRSMQSSLESHRRAKKHGKTDGRRARASVGVGPSASPGFAQCKTSWRPKACYVRALRSFASRGKPWRCSGLGPRGGPPEDLPSTWRRAATPRAPPVGASAPPPSSPPHSLPNTWQSAHTSFGPTAPWLPSAGGRGAVLCVYYE